MEETQTTIPYKLHSVNSIGMSALLGTPVMSGIMLWRNYVNLGDKRKGQMALFLCIAATVAIMGAILLIPGNIITYVPTFLIPLIYSFIIWVQAGKIQGKAVDAHAEAGGEYYSGWHMVGLSLLAGIMVTALFVAVFLASSTRYDGDKYEEMFNQWSRIEEQIYQEVVMLELNWDESIKNDNKYSLALSILENNIGVNTKSNLALARKMANPMYLNEWGIEVTNKMKSLSEMRKKQAGILMNKLKARERLYTGDYEVLKDAIRRKKDEIIKMMSGAL